MPIIEWMKKFSIVLMAGLLAGATIILPQGFADESAAAPVPVDVFERADCSHCIDEKAFLADLEQEMPGAFALTFHDIADSGERGTFMALAEQMELSKATPITVINGIVLQGFGTAATTGKQIRKLIEEAARQPRVIFEEAFQNKTLKSAAIGGATCDTEGDVPCETGPNEFWISVPFYGPVEVLQYSLPTMSLLLGFVDGFNPCAMWVLVMFLTILAEAGSRRRMFEMAGLFILAEAIMYYLILNVWMTAWDFVGMDRIVTPIVGAVALGAGSYFLYLFYKDDQTCKVGDMGQKRRTSEKIRHYAAVPMTFAVAAGILGLAFSVNIIEFACSIGIPQTFTKILDFNYLTWAGKQFYNALYILMYMIDDLIVFGLALYSFERIGLTTRKYTKISHFIGGAIMVALGIIMLFKPSLLIFS